MKVYSFSNEVLTDIGTQLAPRISKSINKVRKAQPGVRIKADTSEWILSEAIRTAKLGPSGWAQGSKNIKNDMWLTVHDDDLGRIDASVSHKTGIVDLNRKKLKFSGYRLGRFNGLEQQVKQIPKLSADMFVYIAGQPKATANDPYYLMLLSGKALKYGKPEQWVETDTHSSFSSDKLSARINKNMSHQLWTDLNIDDEVFLVEL